MNQALDALRRRIDGIDNRLLDLLRERTDVVLEIAQAKGLEPNSAAMGLAMRPAREAVILRRLLRRDLGPLPAAVVMRLWRELFAFTTRLQAPMEVCLPTAPDGASLWDLARFYYGPNTPMRRLSSAAEVIGEVEGAASVLGILPLPRPGSADGDWWRRLIGRRTQIIARLPFLKGAPAAAPQAFVVASLSPEESGDDTTVLAVSLAPEVSAHVLPALLGDLGLARATVAAVSEDGSPCGSDVLMEVPGFIAKSDARLGRGKAPLTQLKLIGAYANPLEVVAEVRS